MVIIAKKVGRLANRLLLFSHFIGTAVEHGFSVANPAFGTYAHYFPSTARDLFCRFPQARLKPPMGRIGREILYRTTLLAANTLHVMQLRGRVSAWSVSSATSLSNWTVRRSCHCLEGTEFCLFKTGGFAARPIARSTAT